MNDQANAMNTQANLDFRAQVDLLIEEVRLLESGDRDRMIRFLAQVAVSAMGEAKPEWLEDMLP